MSHRGLTVVERNPVALRAAVVALATAIVHVLVVRGVLSHDDELAIGSVIDALGLVILVVWTRAGVTPNAKVVTRVTTGGAVVAGDAAKIATGTQLHVGDTLGGVRAVVESVVVNPDLVHP